MYEKCKIDPYTLEVLEMDYESEDIPVADTYVPDQDLIADAFNKAVVHAERVSKREHIKADRVERVNQFIVSLRRELGAVCGDHKSTQFKDLVGALLKKEAWYDIGQLHPSYPDSWSRISRNILDTVIQTAERLRKNTSLLKLEIEGDLEELERSLAGIDLIVKETEKINDEGEQVMGQLTKMLVG